MIVRQAQKQDAAQMIDYMQTLAAEPEVAIGLSPGEFTLTLQEEMEHIQKMKTADNSIILLALDETRNPPRMIGEVGLRGGHRQATHHSAALGISVVADWRGRGLGATLMQHVLDWARQSSTLTRIELNVFTSNLPAIRLYARFGFQVEGLRRRALFRDGRYHDDLIMALLLERD